MKKLYHSPAGQDRTGQDRTGRSFKSPCIMLLLIFFILPYMSAQQTSFECGTEDFNTSIGTQDYSECNDLSRYIPGYQTDYSLSKLLTINLEVFVMCHNGDTITRNFNNNFIPIDFAFLNYFINNFWNPKLSSLSTPRVPNPAPTLEQSSTGIQIKLTKIHYVEAPSPSFSNNWSMSNFVKQKLNALYPNQENKSIVLFLGRRDGGQWGGFSEPSSHSHFFTLFSPPVTWEANIGDFTGIHELGHSLGLPHTGCSNNYCDGDGIDDTDFDFLNCGSSFFMPQLLDNGCYTSSTYIDSACPNYWMGYRKNCEPDYNYFTPKQIAIMRRNLEYDKKYYGSSYQYYNMPNYTKVLANCQINPATTPYEVNTTELWTKAVVLDNDLVIKSGNTLTIQCRVNMPETGKIIIESGARLIIDGGSITNACGYMWDGIRVYGNSSLAQTLQPNGYYPQAHLIMKNGAVVENARNAVTNWKYNDYTKTGGLIQASNSTFRNNGRSVEFVAYDFPEKSSFIECSFIMDDTLKDGSLPSSMVTMWGVNGTRFIGNSFVCVDSIALLPSQRPKGIYTINAGFFVRPKCIQNPPPVGACPSQYSIPNSFKGLQIGIHATNADNYTFRVENARFDNCQYGLLASHVNNYTVIKSRFNVHNYYSTGLGIGLWNEFSTGFIIEENTFTGKGSKDQDLLLGLINSETGTAHNEIYKNNFDSLRLATWVSGINWAYGGGNTSLGLKYKCNSFQENNGDIFVLGGTIGQNQGSVEPLSGGGFEFYPAQNTFSTLNDPVGHFANYGQNHVYYIYYNDVPGLQYEPTNRTMNNVSVQEADINFVNLGCPTHFPSIDASFPAPNPTTYNHFQVLKQAYNDAAYTYYNYLDGGNTPSLIQQIESAWPEEALQLRNDLLNDSPFLSMEALYGIADKTDVLPHAFMLDIFLANPHGGRDQAFLDYLLNKADPMPSYMVDVLQGDTTITLKDQMESTMSRYASEYSSIANLAIHYYRTDSINANADSVQAWLIRKGDYANALEQADQKAGATLYNVALTHLGNLGGSYLPDYLLSEQNAREDLWQMLESFQNQNQEYWSLDSAKQLQLQNFALNESYTANTMAKNILEFFYGFTFPKVIPQVNIPEPKSKKSQSQKQESKIDIRVYPNPAEQYISFDMGSQGKNGAKIEVSDMQGKTILQRNMTQKLYILDIRSLHSGTYIYRIIDNDELYTGTFIKK